MSRLSSCTAFRVHVKKKGDGPSWNVVNVLEISSVHLSLTFKEGVRSGVHGNLAPIARTALLDDPTRRRLSCIQHMKKLSEIIEQVRGKMTFVTKCYLRIPGTEKLKNHSNYFFQHEEDTSCEMRKPFFYCLELDMTARRGLKSSVLGKKPLSTIQNSQLAADRSLVESMRVDRGALTHCDSHDAAKCFVFSKWNFSANGRGHDVNFDQSWTVCENSKTGKSADRTCTESLDCQSSLR